MADMVITVATDHAAAASGFAETVKAAKRAKDDIVQVQQEQIDRAAFAQSRAQAKMRADLDQQARMSQVLAKEQPEISFGSRSRDWSKPVQEMSGKSKAAMTQAMFAAQDFAAVMSMGGANSFGRAMLGASNNIGVMGAAMGPWGLAITSSIAILSPFIGKLFETKTALDSVKESLSDTAAQRSFDSSLREKSTRFSRGFSEDFDTAEKGRQGIKDRQTEIAVLTDKLQEAKQVRDQLLVGADASGQTFVAGSEALTDVNDIQKRFREVKSLAAGASFSNAMKLDPEIKKSLEEVDQIQREIAARRRGMQMIQGTMPSLQRKENEKLGRESAVQTAQELERLDQEKQAVIDVATAKAKARDQEAQQLFDRTRTPQERFGTDVYNLGRQFNRGLIDDQTFGRRLSQLKQEAIAAMAPRSENRALEGGSREEIEAAQAANRQEQLMQELKKTSDDMLVELKKIAKTKPVKVTEVTG